MKKHKTIVLLFPSLITSICVVLRVHLDAKDEHVKNDGVLTTRTIERIAGEVAGALPEPTAVVGARRIVGLEQRIQALSTSITQCAEARQRENNWFWSYLQHLEDHLHQFAVYMKCTHRNFPDSLLQQFNFGTSTTDAQAVVSEDATDTYEPEEEAAAEPQAEADTDADEQLDQPEEEGVKSTIDSSPTELDEEPEKELEEPPARTSSKSRKKHII